jgi:hypothetical protein
MNRSAIAGASFANTTMSQSQPYVKGSMVNGRSTAKNVDTSKSEFQKIDFASKTSGAGLSQNEAGVNIS